MRLTQLLKLWLVIPALRATLPPLGPAQAGSNRSDIHNGNWFLPASGKPVTLTAILVVSQHDVGVLQ